jgi:hypothetical protein
MINPSSEINTNGGKRHGKKDGLYAVAEWQMALNQEGRHSNFQQQEISFVQWGSL